MKDAEKCLAKVPTRISLCQTIEMKYEWSILGRYEKKSIIKMIIYAKFLRRLVFWIMEQVVIPHLSILRMLQVLRYYCKVTIIPQKKS